MDHLEERVHWYCSNNVRGEVETTETQPMHEVGTTIVEEFEVTSDEWTYVGVSS